MVKRSSPEWQSPLEKEIEKLRQELSSANRTILDLMPPNIRQILDSYHSCTSTDSIHEWRVEAIEKLIRSAKILSREEGSYWDERAYCPLCGDGSTSPYASGFKVPEGLRRHLDGYGNNSRCGVMVAARKLAEDYLTWSYGASEKVQQAEQLKQIEERKLNETLYLTSPDGPPELIETGRYWSPERCDKGIVWAESRLTELGFKIKLDGKTKSYIDDREDIIVYADPRTDKEISFRAYKKPLSKRANKALKHFKLRDSWKHGLKEKYQTWLLEPS